MLDREGFRPNVGIVLLNARNEVFWGKRLREHSWQFPQGGIKFGETPVQAMYRELHEEVGLKPEHVKVIGRTRDWLRYEVPDRFIRREVRGHYRGQKQIWFLLRMVGRDCDICLRATNHPEFDAWRWNSYWVPLEAVIEFKRDVYHLALTELSRFVRRMHLKSDAEGNGAMSDMHGDMGMGGGMDPCMDVGKQHDDVLHEDMQDVVNALVHTELMHEVTRTHVRVVTHSRTVIVSGSAAERGSPDEKASAGLVSPIIHK